MFFKLIALFALLAVAFAAPKPNPQLLTYSTGLDYVYPAYSGVPSVISPYSAGLAPLTYNYPANTYFVR